MKILTALALTLLCVEAQAILPCHCTTNKVTYTLTLMPSVFTPATQSTKITISYLWIVCPCTTVPTKFVNPPFPPNTSPTTNDVSQPGNSLSLKSPSPAGYDITEAAIIDPVAVANGVYPPYFTRMIPLTIETSSNLKSWSRRAHSVTWISPASCVTVIYSNSVPVLTNCAPVIGGNANVAIPLCVVAGDGNVGFAKLTMP